MVSIIFRTSITVISLKTVLVRKVVWFPRFRCTVLDILKSEISQNVLKRSKLGNCTSDPRETKQLFELFTGGVNRVF